MPMSMRAYAPQTYALMHQALLPIHKMGELGVSITTESEGANGRRSWTIFTQCAGDPSTSEGLDRRDSSAWA